MWTTGSYSCERYSMFPLWTIFSTLIKTACNNIRYAYIEEGKKLSSSYFSPFEQFFVVAFSWAEKKNVVDVDFDFHFGNLLKEKSTHFLYRWHACRKDAMNGLHRATEVIVPRCDHVGVNTVWNPRWVWCNFSFLMDHSLGTDHLGTMTFDFSFFAHCVVGNGNLFPSSIGHDSSDVVWF